MDPITGLWILAGTAAGSLAALRLKKNMEEGFEALPNTQQGYPSSISESQTRYNAFTSLLNPLTNSIVPVGSSQQEVEKKKELVSQALGSTEADYSSNSAFSLVLDQFKNQFQLRGDPKKSFFSAMKFCQEAGKNAQPFSIYNPDGTVAQQGAVSADGTWKFDEICGVCLTEGVDEEGKMFNKQQGMILSPSEVQAALSEQSEKNYPFPRIGPALGKCVGSPNSPAFAINAKDLEKYQRAKRCAHGKTLGGSDSCGLCYGSNDVFSSVPPNVATMPITFLLNGSGICRVLVNGRNVSQITLRTGAPQEVLLRAAKEGDSFILDVRGTGNTPAEIYGYLKSYTPRSTNEKNGLFTMPLNLLTVVDDESGATPNKTGRFPRYEDVDLDVATMGPASGRQRMRLRGTIPFTFVQPTEFAALDCMDAPYQTKEASANAFSTDQPCFAKGTGPGKYNDECLRARILSSGCTDSGDLYKNPKALNTVAGQAQTLSKIMNRLQGIKELDLLDETATKQCSGRTIQTKCDPFMNNSKKFGPALQSSNNQVKTQAVDCLAFIYNNSGANEKTSPPKVGPTYSGMVTYKNNTKEIKNIYCLPEGKLNPTTSKDAAETLARIGDNGYKNLLGVDAIKKFLNDQLELAVDMTKNVNADPDRKAAIENCFGRSINNLPFALGTGSPTVIADPVRVSTGIVIRHPNGKSIKNDNGILRLNKGTELSFSIVSNNSVYKNNLGYVALYQAGTSNAIRHSGLVMYLNPFTTNNGDFAWKIIPRNNGFILQNEYFNGAGWNNPRVGSYLNYNPTNDLLFISNGPPNNNTLQWTFSPLPLESLTRSS